VAVSTPPRRRRLALPRLRLSLEWACQVHVSGGQSGGGASPLRWTDCLTPPLSTHACRAVPCRAMPRSLSLSVCVCVCVCADMSLHARNLAVAALGGADAVGTLPPSEVTDINETMSVVD
jgi:hypothetical protein